VYDWGHVKMGIYLSNPLSVGGVFWADGKLKILELNPACWNKLTD